MLRLVSKLKGTMIQASDGPVGSADDVLFDDASWKVRWLVVDTDQMESGRHGYYGYDPFWGGSSYGMGTIAAAFSCGSMSRARTLGGARAGGVALNHAALCVLLLLAGLAVQSRQAAAADATETFGPGQVNCQALTGTRMDCLLAANRVSRGNGDVATFSVTDLPRGDQALFRKWCLTAADECTVTVTGQRASPQSTRLSSVASVHWTRLSAPMSDAAAVLAAKPSTTGPAVGAAR